MGLNSLPVFIMELSKDRRVLLIQYASEDSKRSSSDVFGDWKFYLEEKT